MPNCNSIVHYREKFGLLDNGDDILEGKERRSVDGGKERRKRSGRRPIRRSMTR